MDASRADRGVTCSNKFSVLLSVPSLALPAAVILSVREPALSAVEVNLTITNRRDVAGFPGHPRSGGELETPPSSG
jgi:hypothetical protein